MIEHDTIQGRIADRNRWVHDWHINKKWRKCLLKLYLWWQFQLQTILMAPQKKKIVADFTVYFITKRVVSFIVKRSCKQNGWWICFSFISTKRKNEMHFGTEPSSLPKEYRRLSRAKHVVLMHGRKNLRNNNMICA